MDTTGGRQHPVFEGVDLGVGTWSWGDRLYWGFGQGYAAADLRAAFDASLAAGICFFDTAEIYGQGRSEAYLGQFLQEGVQQPVRLATKFMPYPWRLSRGSLLRALRGSLKRLGRAQVDLYQVHMPLPPLKVETWMEAMADAHQAGLIGAVGVSNFDRAQMQRAADTLTREGIALASNQMEYHLLNRKIEQNGLLQHCRDLGVTLIAYSPLALGVLSGKYTPDNPPPGLRSRRFGRKYLTQVQPLILALKKIGVDHAGKTAAQVALNWVMCKGALPIPGAKTVEQAEQNAGAAGWRLSADEVALLDEVSERVIQKSG